MGIGLGNFATYTQVLVVPILGLIMAISITSISNRDFGQIRAMARPILWSLLLNYIVLGAIMLLAAYFLVGSDSALWGGFVLLAAVPPAVAVVPYANMLGGNARITLFGMLGAYLLALGYTPGMATLLLGPGTVDPLQIFITLAELVIAPLLISRLIRLKDFAERIHIAAWRGAVVNWGFFLVIFTIIGLNRDVFFGEFDVLWRVALIGAVCTFLLSFVVERVTRRWHIGRPEGIAYILLSTSKNNGMASALALTLLGDRAAIPGAVCTVFSICSIIWLTFYLRRKEGAGEGGLAGSSVPSGPGLK